MTLKRLEDRVRKAQSAREYFDAIFDYVVLDLRNSTEWENENPTRLCFFTQGFSGKVVNILLNCPNSPEFFKTVRELRIVATRIDADGARRLKSLNPATRVHLISDKEWIGRPVGAPDPVDFFNPPGGVEV